MRDTVSDAGTVSRSLVDKAGNALTNARDVVARHVRELRRVYGDVPNAALQKLIRMNKQMYAEAFEKAAK